MFATWVVHRGRLLHGGWQAHVRDVEVAEHQEAGEGDEAKESLAQSAQATVAGVKPLVMIETIDMATSPAKGTHEAANGVRKYASSSSLVCGGMVI